MEFEIRVVKSSSLVGEKDYKKVATKFLQLIGYMGNNADEHSIPYHLFECFLLHPGKKWTVEELMATLKATKATVYRHLNKLKAMDLLEEGKEGEGIKVKKTYQLRYGNVAKAWNFVEAHVKVAMEQYAETVHHLQKLVEKRHLK
ncbi:MAG: transcriptional regulator [Thermoplasmata archaeon]|nr:MAG: transcriptional regulator [Thermoplasmata archaeon]RLF58191.1 MAG: transcriptional regulator [Thermoplasmata archaeon]